MTYISGVSGDFEFRSNRSITSNDIKPFEFKSQRSLINGKFSFKGNAEKFVFEKTPKDFSFKGSKDKFVFEKGQDTKFVFEGSDDILLDAITEALNNQFLESSQGGRFTPGDGYQDYQEEEFVFQGTNSRTGISAANTQEVFRGSEDIILKEVFRIRLKQLPPGLRVLPRFRNSDSFYFMGTSDFLMEAIKKEQEKDQKVLKGQDPNNSSQSFFSDNNEEDFVYLGIYDPSMDQAVLVRMFTSDDDFKTPLDPKPSPQAVFEDSDRPSRMVYANPDRPQFQPLEKITSKNQDPILVFIESMRNRKETLQKFLKRIVSLRESIAAIEEEYQKSRDIKSGEPYIKPSQPEPKSHQDYERIRLEFKPPRESKFAINKKPNFEKRTESIMEFGLEDPAKKDMVVFEGAETIEKKEVFRLRIRQLPPGAVCMPSQRDSDSFVVVGSSALPMEQVLEMLREEEKFIESIKQRKDSSENNNSQDKSQEILDQQEDKSESLMDKAFDPSQLFKNSSFLEKLISQEKFLIDRSSEKFTDQKIEEKLQNEMLQKDLFSNNLVLDQEVKQNKDDFLIEDQSSSALAQDDFYSQKSSRKAALNQLLADIQRESKLRQDQIFESQSARLESSAGSSKQQQSSPKKNNPENPERNITRVENLRNPKNIKKLYSPLDLPTAQLENSSNVEKPSSTGAPAPSKDLSKIAPPMVSIRRLDPSELPSLDFLKTELQTNALKISDELIKNLDKNLIATLLIQNYKQIAATMANPTQVQITQNNGLINLVSAVEYSKTKNSL